MRAAHEPPVTVVWNSSQSRARIILHHPKGNILTVEAVESLRRALRSASSSAHLKLVTVEGEGPDFSFGASIPEHRPEAIGRALQAMHQLIADLLSVPAPTAAVVRGRCLGGGFELALGCDFILASEDAVFGLSEIRLGGFPPAAAALMPWRTGGARATSAVLTGELRGAREWRTAGLIEMIRSEPDLDGAVDAWFEERLEPLSAAALRRAVTAVRMALRAHIDAYLPQLERLYLDDLMRTADAVEGVQAFLEKRPPRWIDR